jgi:hypothetical protein
MNGGKARQNGGMDFLLKKVPLKNLPPLFQSTKKYAKIARFITTDLIGKLQ